jgi:hypothetical protein
MLTWYVDNVMYYIIAITLSFVRNFSLIYSGVNLILMWSYLTNVNDR